MKKTILVSLVAVMMLFAFTACEQPVPGLSKAIIDADIVQNGTFLEGQPFDASKFSVNVTYSDGTKGTLEGVNVVYVGSAGSAASVKNGDKVTVKLPTSAPNYSGNVATSETTFEGSIVAYEIDSLSVAGTLPVIDWEGTVTSDTDLKAYATGLTVTANYRDSNGTAQVYTLDASEWTIVRGALTKAPSATEDVTATATIKDTLQKKIVSVPVTFTYVEPKDEEPVDSDYTEWFNHQVVYEQVEPTTTVKYIQRGTYSESTMLKFYKVMVVEGTTALTDDNFRLVALSASDYESLSTELAAPLAGTGNEKRFGTAATANVNFEMKYISDAAYGAIATKTAVDGSVSDLEESSTGYYTGDITTSNTIQLTGIIADYPKSLTATWLGKGGVASTAYTEGEGIVVGTDFKVVASWASGITGDAYTVITSNVTCDHSVAPEVESDGSSVPVVLTYNLNAGEYSDSVYTANSTITVNQAN